ncbi:hypothetical protein ES703_40388 [subsurface metagenome]
MASIKFGGLVTEARGSIAGNTFARNKSGAYVRARTKPVNPKSDRQCEARVRIQVLAEYWHSALMSDVERGAWESYAKAVAMSNKLGEVIYLSGFNHFVRSNAARLAALGSIIEPGPEIQALPEADVSLAAAGDNGTQLLNIFFDNTKGWALETGGYLLIEMGRPQLKTRQSFGGPYRVAGAIPGETGNAPTSPQTIAAPFTLSNSQKIWVRASILRLDGRVSNKFYAPAFLVSGLLPKYFASCDPAPVPDCQCNYVLGGAFNGKAYFIRSDGIYKNWWDGVDTWTISLVLGTPGDAFWTLATASPVGVYTLGGTATGAPEFSAGEHPL